MPCTSFLNMCYSEIWILYSFKFSSTIMHVFVSPVKTAVQTWNFLWIYICAFYPVPWLYVQKKHKLACCCCFKYLQLEILGEKNCHNFIPPLLSLCTVYSGVTWLSYWHWPTAPWQWGPNQYGYLAGLLHCTQCMIWQNTHNMQNKHMMTAPISIENKVHSGH